MRPSDFQAFIAAEGYQAAPNFKKRERRFGKSGPWQIGPTARFVKKSYAKGKYQ